MMDKYLEEFDGRFSGKEKNILSTVSKLVPLDDKQLEVLKKFEKFVEGADG